MSAGLLIAICADQQTRGTRAYPDTPGWSCYLCTGVTGARQQLVPEVPVQADAYRTLGGRVAQVVLDFEDILLGARAAVARSSKSHTQSSCQ